MVSSLSSVLPTSQVFTSGYVNTETILHFFAKISNERGMKTVFTYAHLKWFYGQSERTYYLNYFITCFISFIFGAKTNTTRRKGKYRKYLEHKSLLAADCHDLQSQHKLIHETIGSILIKTWTLSTWVLTLWCTMLNE